MRTAILFTGFFYFMAFANAQPTVRQVRRHSSTFVISARESQGNLPIPARFQIRAVLSGTAFDGRSTAVRPFFFTLNRTDTLRIRSSADGFLVSEEVLFVPCDTCARFVHSVLLERIDSPDRPDSIFHDLKVNDKIRLDNVYFDQSSYVLRKESYPQLEKLLKTLEAYPNLVIEIAGHTDNVGDRRLNQALSENRAQVITNYLIHRGIAENRLVFRGYGDTHPAAPNDNEYNKKKNRRVEFTVLKL
ncbi:OmpA family protein [Larkinella soli]|uniref:OmpA family protein n=1 Tax=Larkinella soli TaxID=1770527 RepID=UPI000FFB5014|nr:OmpA family protein [Larkinella soli]